MLNWTALGVLVAVAAGVAALGVWASIRFGVAGRRIAASLALMCMVLLPAVPLMAPKVNGSQARAITCLRALNAAQLLYSTSVGAGTYAKTLDELAREGEWKSSACPPIQLRSSGESYTAIAVSKGHSRLKEGPPRTFCVGQMGTIFWAPTDVVPVVDVGRCPPGWKPIQ